MNTVIAIIAIAVILFIAFKVFKVIIRILLVVLFLGIAYLTNPSYKHHEAAVMHRARNNKLNPSNLTVNVKNLHVASITKIQSSIDSDESKIIGIGLFTQVFIFRDPEL